MSFVNWFTDLFFGKQDVPYSSININTGVNKMGKRKAVLVGLNYTGLQNSLNGCINDTLTWQQLLTERYGFTDPQNRRMLIDSSATKSAIVERLNWLVTDNQPGDELFFSYSGHGSQVPSNERDEEPDGLSEVICPWDLLEKGDWRNCVLRDKEMAAIFAKIPDGVRLTVIMDCCHSSDNIREVLDPYIHPSPSPFKNRGLKCPPDVMNRIFGTNYQPNKGKDIFNNIDYSKQIGINLAGCRSDQTSCDAFIAKTRKYQGAFTYYVSVVLAENNYSISYQDLMYKTKQLLIDNGYDQEPQINCVDKFKDMKFLL